MLPSKNEWENIESCLGIKNSDHIIVYDDSDVFLHSVTWQKEINGEDNSLDESEWNDWRDDMLKQQGDMYSVTWTDITVTEDA